MWGGGGAAAGAPEWHFCEIYALSTVLYNTGVLHRPVLSIYIIHIVKISATRIPGYPLFLKITM